MPSDHPRKVDIRLTRSVKITALSNIRLAYQLLPCKQSSKSWIILYVLPRLKPLGVPLLLHLI